MAYTVTISNFYGDRAVRFLCRGFKNISDLIVIFKAKLQEKLALNFENVSF